MERCFSFSYKISESFRKCPLIWVLNRFSVYDNDGKVAIELQLTINQDIRNLKEKNAVRFLGS